MKISNKKILVTGGATGIGAGIAARFLQDNNTVIVCGRKAEALKEAAEKHPGLITKQCDLATAESREALYSWISSEHPDLNILVNNAGVQNWMDLDDPGFYEKAKQEIAINIEAPIHLASLFTGLKKLETIMNVSSGLSFTPFARVPVYSATKAFMRSFTLSLRHLMKAKNIQVVEIIPPALNTDLGGKGLHDHAPPVSDFIDEIFDQMEQGLSELSFGSSTSRLNAGAEELRKAFEMMNNS